MKKLFYEFGIIKKRQFLFAALGLLSLGIGIFFRLYPAVQNPDRSNLLFLDMQVRVNLRNSIMKNIDEAYPGLPPDKKNSILDTQYKRIAGKNSEKIRDTALNLLKTSDDLLFRFYLLGADSYYYFYLTEKILENGTIAEKIRHGKFFEPLMTAPSGHWRILELHPFIGAYLHKFLNIFHKGLSPMISVSILPLLLFTLSLALFMIVCYRSGFGVTESFTGSVFFSSSPIFLQRSSIGWYDTDPYNVIFLLSMILLFQGITDRRKPHICTLLLALLSGLYSLLWQGWLIMPVLAVFVFMILSVVGFYRKNSGWLYLKQLVLYVVSLAFFSVLLLTPRGFGDSVKDIIAIFSEFLFLKPNLWPDIFLTVGELKSPTTWKLLHVLGGFIFLPVSFIGAIFFLSRKGTGNIRTMGIVLGILYFIELALAKNAQRFIIFFLPIAAICLVEALSRIRHVLNGVFSRFFGPGKRGIPAFTCFLVYTLTGMPLFYAHISASDQNPIFNSVWLETLDKIKKQTPGDSIINTWWPPGHFIKAVSNRRVTFDGATINIPQAYWMASFLLSEEQEAIGILRMLNLSGNAATGLLTENGLPLDKAVDIIKSTVAMDISTARQFLSKYLPADKIDEFIYLTHGIPPPSYCLIYNELAEDAIGLYYVKKWDFGKAVDFERKRIAELKKFNLFWRGTKNIIKSVWDISGGMTYIGKEVFAEKDLNDIVYFPNGVMFNKKYMEIWLNRLEDQISGIPGHLIFMTKSGDVSLKKLDKANIKLAVFIKENPDGKFSCIVAPFEILNSVLFRMYYMDGAGLEYFELFEEDYNPVLDTRILVYRIKWPEDE